MHGVSAAAKVRVRECASLLLPLVGVEPEVLRCENGKGIIVNKPPLRRALNLLRKWESEGYIIPVGADEAIKYRGVGPSILRALIELDVVWDPFHELSTRPRNALYAYGLSTKEQVAEHIYFVGKRKDARAFHNIEYKGAIRNLGFKGYLEICDWLGKP